MARQRPPIPIRNSRWWSCSKTRRIPRVCRARRARIRLRASHTPRTRRLTARPRPLPTGRTCRIRRAPTRRQASLIQQTRHTAPQPAALRPNHPRRRCRAIRSNRCSMCSPRNSPPGAEPAHGLIRRVMYFRHFQNGCPSCIPIELCALPRSLLFGVFWRISGHGSELGGGRLLRGAERSGGG